MGVWWVWGVRGVKRWLLTTWGGAFVIAVLIVAGIVGVWFLAGIKTPFSMP